MTRTRVASSFSYTSVLVEQRRLPFSEDDLQEIEREHLLGRRGGNVVGENDRRELGGAFEGGPPLTLLVRLVPDDGGGAGWAGIDPYALLIRPMARSGLKSPTRTMVALFGA